MEKFITGAQVFFKDLEGFKPKTVDTLFIVTPIEARGFSDYQQITLREKCYTYLVHYSKKEIFGSLVPVGIFLCPDVAKYLELTIADLRKFDSRFKGYERVIYEAYLKNNSFTIKPEQLQEAYNKYKDEAETC